MLVLLPQINIPTKVLKTVCDTISNTPREVCNWVDDTQFPMYDSNTEVPFMGNVFEDRFHTLFDTNLLPTVQTPSIQTITIPSHAIDTYLDVTLTIIITENNSVIVMGLGGRDECDDVTWMGLGFSGDMSELVKFIDSIPDEDFELTKLMYNCF